MLPNPKKPGEDEHAGPSRSAQSQLPTVTPQDGAMADSANSSTVGSCAAHAKAGGSETVAPSAHCKIRPSIRAEVYAHPLSSEEESTAQDLDAVSEGSESAAASGTSLNIGASSTCCSGTGRLKSADASAGSHRKARPDGSPDAEAEGIELSQSRTSSTWPESLAAHSKAGPDMDEPPARSPESASCAYPSSREKYDFMMWYHPEDEEAAEKIYNFLEGVLNLNGYRYSRDKALGTYKLSEIGEAIKNCCKVLLFVTPRSKDCRMFEVQMHNSLNNSIETNRRNVIPILWELSSRQVPNVVRGIYSIWYQDCSETFKKQIARIFKLLYPEPFTSSVPGNTSSHRSVQSSVSPSLGHSLSAPCATTKTGFFAWLFSYRK